jgi:hypothetical protein
MSSVTRFIRQIPVSTTYYSAAAIVSAAGTPATSPVFEFVPTQGNYVGNYPPGYMISGSLALNQEIVNVAAIAGSTGNVVLRDMGKTIQAPYVVDGTAAPSGASIPTGFFRQVQLIVPSAIDIGTAGKGYIGGTGGSTFGVRGGPQNPDVYTNYLTFYIPVSVAGVEATGVVSTGAFALAGGQM